MNPILRTHTKENMSMTKEGKQKDTMSKETNCNMDGAKYKGVRWGRRLDVVGEGEIQGIDNCR